MYKHLPSGRPDIATGKRAFLLLSCLSWSVSICAGAPNVLSFARILARVQQGVGLLRLRSVAVSGAGSAEHVFEHAQSIRQLVRIDWRLLLLPLFLRRELLLTLLLLLLLLLL